LAQRNEFVSFVIRRVVNPGLQAAFHVHRGGWWVDPPGSYNHQHCNRPQKRHSEDKPSNKESEKSFPKQGLGVCVWAVHYAGKICRYDVLLTSSALERPVPPAEKLHKNLGSSTQADFGCGNAPRLNSFSEQPKQNDAFKGSAFSNKAGHALVTFSCADQTSRKRRESSPPDGLAASSCHAALREIAPAPTRPS